MTAGGDAVQLVDMMNGAMPFIIPTAHHMGVRVVEARRGYAAATVPAEGKTVATRSVPATRTRPIVVMR
jgi:hypothetical protein